MGLLNWLGLDAVNPTGVDTASRGIASPWVGETHLTKVALSEIFDVAEMPVTRAEAISVPAVAKARHLICEVLARQPLKAYKDGVEVEDQPTWLYRTNSMVGPRMRTLWVLDDLLFYGWSLLAVERGSEDQILDAARVDKRIWRFNAKAQVEVVNEGRWKVASAEQVVLVPGLGDGLLAEAARTVRKARNLEDRWGERVNDPVAVTEIRYTGDEVLEKSEMDEIRETYLKARAAEGGTVMVTPSGFEVHAHGDQALDLFTEGRNAATLDVARHTNVPATLLDASNVNATSHSYQNEALGRSAFLDLSLRSWALPLEERLSMDDVVPRGTSVAFDLSGITIPDTGTGPVLAD